ncbi:MAG: Recombination protein RecR [Candidatus Shapirobacteria bacterium GW2011_GWE1_38_92]|uniref:Recombination protein RecR n=1 Tax=Candidatus Shapirobacteria bacterium GW2011_GWE1_38_92 TaxID=1618489 RepID=A0A0G0PLP3_9BACT|nr:MAG: Recombination protein RecR [Candidatus Shapirobacteria bacterium GW2011_GWE1_38_92]
MENCREWQGCNNMAEFPQAIKKLISAFERLPGVGPKSATRLAFYLLNTPQDFIADLSNSILEVKSKVKICSACFGVGESEICGICDDNKRNKKEICVVEMKTFKGVYHVLGGVINPLDHIGPEELKIAELVVKIKNLLTEDEAIEVILATNPTMEGEATALYIKKKLLELDNRGKLLISRIGSGLPMGADLEYADESTLARAMEGRREL